MKIKRIVLYVNCLLLLAMVGCNNLGQEERDDEDFRGLGTTDEQTFDDYRLNEEEQLYGRGEIETKMDRYGMISNANTDISSGKYPHTKAIQIQQAKYKFVISGGAGAGQKPAKGAPTPKQVVPTQKQATPEQATPKQEAPAPTPEQDTPITKPQPKAPVEQPEAATPQPEQPQQEQTPTTEGISEAAAKVIELTNAERRKNGLSDFQADSELSNVATMKSDDMQQNNYFSHTSPTHGSPFDMMRDQGVSYSAAGENIAQGQSTPEQVVESWMNSEGHRKNIMSGNFTHIGVGYNKQGHYWTQMFISK